MGGVGGDGATAGARFSDAEAVLVAASEAELMTAGTGTETPLLLEVTVDEELEGVGFVTG